MEIKRLFEIPYHQLEKYPQVKALGNKVNGVWTYYSSQELVDTINHVSLGLLKLGLKPGDKVVLASYNNRPEWNIMDYGLQQIGVISVPVYPTISPREYEYIFNDAGVKYCFVGDADLFRKVKEAMPNVPTLKDVYTFDIVEGAKNWLEVHESGDLREVEKLKAQVKYEDLATIIYTSGTTGNPKGVMLSHRNIISNLLATAKELPVEPGHKALSFLPLCHSFERMVSYVYMFRGVNVSYAESIESLGENLKEIKPNWFTTVPRLLEKVYEKIVNKGRELTGVKHSLFFWAMDLTEDYVYDKKYGLIDGIKHAIADKLIFSKWREALGGEIIGIVTGAAACPHKIAKTFSAAGVPIREGYGLTETSPVLTYNRFYEGGAQLGTVGFPIDQVVIKIAEDGEILAKGPNIMMGYYNQPEKTKEDFTDDGWFKTGDIGELKPGPNGKPFLRITDRKKELLKTSGGKYVAPAPIESKFSEDFFIGQMMVLGEGQKFVSALIVPSWEELEKWAKEKGISYKDHQDLIQKPEVQKKYQEVLERFNPNFSHIEQIKKFKLLPNEWTIEGGELTPTMKLKRRVIMQKYAPQIKEIYG